MNKVLKIVSNTLIIFLFPLILHSLFLTPAYASSLSSTSYTYDNLGNILQITNNLQPTTYNYFYDDIYRLERVSGGYSSTYIYDADGNILTKNEDQNLTLTYIPSDSVASHGPKSVNGRLLRYDPNGNLIEDAFSNLKIIYDYENRPVEIRKLDTSVLLAKYFYDGEGKRVKKEVYENGALSKTTQYVNQYFEKEIPIAGQTTVRKFYAGAAYREGSNLTYTTTDHLSSTTLTTNTQGQKIAHYVYYPYGSPNLQLTTSNSQPLPNSWIGQKRDTESNLYFLNARYYSPTYGKFIQADSMVDPTSKGNNYIYAKNNPIGASDPYGNMVDEDSGGGGVEDPISIYRPSFWWYTSQYRNPNEPFTKILEYTASPFYADLKDPAVKEFAELFKDIQKNKDTLGTLKNFTKKYKQIINSNILPSVRQRPFVSGYPSAKNMSEPVDIITQIVRYDVGCRQRALGLQVALKSSLDIHIVLLDLIGINSQGEEFQIHTVTGLPIDGEWYIIDPTVRNRESEDPIILPLKKYTEYLVNIGYIRGIAEKPFALPVGGDPFGVTRYQNIPWLVKAPTPWDK